MPAEPLKGDRSALDVITYPDRHANDLPSSPKHHVPAGSVAGEMLRWDGSKWALVDPVDVSTGSIMTLGTREGDLTVAASPLRIYNKYGVDRTITKVFLAVTTAPVGADLICDVKVNGTSIFTSGNRPKILDGQNTGESSTFIDAAWPDDGYLTWAIDQVGSSTAGADLTVHIIHEPA